MANEKDDLTNITPDPIGFVKKLTGEAVAVSSTGATRELSVGDPVYPFEKIINKSGVILVEFTDGSSMDMGPEDSTVLDEDVIPEKHEVADAEEAATDVSAIQQALQAGADPTQVADATAAGTSGRQAAATIDHSEGAEAGMVLDRDAHETIADAGFDTTGPAGLTGAAIEREVGDVAASVSAEIAAARLGPSAPFLVINPVGPTDDATPDITGTATPNSTVTLLVGNQVLTTKAGPDGFWKVTPTDPLPVGRVITATGTTTDENGNTSPPTQAPVSITDTSTFITIDGPIEVDNVVDAAEQTDVLVSGTSEPNTKVVVSFIDEANGEVVSKLVTTDPNGKWSLTGNEVDLTPLQSGNITVQAVGTDPHNNTATATTAITLQPNVAVTAITDDTGNPTDHITTDQTLEISGTAEPNSTVEVFIDGTSIGTVPSDPNGNWTIDHTATNIPEGPHTITATVTDQSGNTATSTELPITIDVTPPAVAITQITDDSGNPTDFITNDQTLVISGTSEPNSTVEVQIDGTPIGTVQVDPNGNWSIDHTATQLPEGPHTVTATSTDPAGNQATTTQPVTIDVTAPAIDITGITDDSGNPSDFITNDQTLVISGTSDNPNSTVEVFIDGNSIGTVPTDGNGAWSIDHTPTQLPEGPHNITASTTDTAGNTVTTAQPLTIDLTPPAVVITAITDDSGTPADFITNDQNLVISGTTDNPANTVEVFIDGVSIGNAVVDPNGNWSIDHTATTLPEGPHNITATSTDPAGNKTDADQPLTIDVTAPAIAITGITDDTGNPTDFVTTDQTLVISGTSNNPNSTVEVFIDGNSIGTVPTDASGAWSIDHTATTLPEGSYNITATTTDVAGNPATANQPLTIDLTPPAISITTITDDTGNPADFITSDQNLVISGTTDNPANTVEVFIDGVSIGNAVVDPNGNWSIDHTATTLPEGPHNITATSTDPSGQQETAAQPLTIDVTAPTIAITGITDDTGNPADFITNDQTLVISGTSNNPNSTVEVFIDGTSIGTVPTDATGNWNIDHTPTTLPEGAHNITATTVDTAGNVANTAQPLTIDVTAPTIDITGITDDSGNPTDFITNDQTLVISGTSNNPNSTVEVFIDGGSIGTVPTDATGNWSIDHTATSLPEGPHNITATTIDTAGNIANTAQPLTIDVTAPAVAITAITDDSGTPADFITNDQNLVISGTTDNPANTVEVFIDGVSIGNAVVDPNGNWSIDHTATTLPEGPHNITATSTDPAGNKTDADQPLTIDVTAPAIAITGITDDTGNPTDFVTTDQTLVISGTSNNPNNTVEVFIDGNSIGTVPTDASGAWSIDHTATTLPEGAYSITATTVDTTGNPATASQALTIDLTPPAISITAITDDTGTPADFITNDQNLVISGTTDNPANTVEVFIDGVSIGSAVVDPNGNWSIDHTATTLPEGPHNITATTTDPSGQQETTAQPLTIDVTAPVVDITAITDDSGTPADFITNDQTLVISGTSNNPNSTVEVFIDGTSIGTTPTDASGNWSIDHTATSLPEGPHNITASTTDVAGNTGTTDQPLTIDLTPPAVSITAITDDSGTPADFVTNDQTLVISGTTDNAANNVDVFIDNVLIGTAVVDQNGNWSIDHTATNLPEGPHNITATATDSAGNKADTDQPLTIDISAPSITSPDNFSIEENSPAGTVVGSVAAADVTNVTYSFQGGALTSSNGFFAIDPNSGEVSLTQAGADTAAANGLLDYESGIHTDSLNVVVSDSAGNQSTQQLTINITNVNEPPKITANTLDINEGQTVVLGSANLAATDPETNDPALQFTVSNVQNGQFQLVSTGLLVTSFTQAQVANGEIQFVHDGSENPPSYDVTVTDEGGLTDMGSVAVNFTALNEPPVITANTLDITEGQTVVLNSSNLAATDPETNDPDLVFTVSNIQNGQFQLVSDGSVVTSFTQAQVTNNEIQFVHNGSENPPSYTVTVTDEGGLTDTSNVGVSFTNLNEPPIVGDIELSQVIEDNVLVINQSDLLANSSDPDGDTLSVTSLSVDPQYGSLVDNGNGTWTFTPTTHYSGDDVPFSFTVSDGALTTNGNAMLDIIPDADIPNLNIGDPSMGPGNGLLGEYYGVEDPTLAFKLTDVPGVVANNSPDATFVSTSVNYTGGIDSLGTGNSLQQFLKQDAASLSTDPGDTTHGVINLKGFIYLEAGTYTISALHDDGISIDIGGENVLTREGFASTRIDSTFTIDNSGVYSFNLDYYDQGSIHNLDLLLGLQGQALEPLSQAFTYQTLTDAENAVDDGGLVYVDNPSGMDYYTVTGNTGYEDTYIELVDLNAALVDVDGSESLVMALENIPVGAELTDGTNKFTATAGNTTVDVSIGWNLSNLSIKPPANFNGTFDLNFKATSIEQLNNDQAANSQTITVTVLPVADVPTASDFTIDLNEQVTTDGDSSDEFTTYTFSQSDFTDASKGNYFDEQGDALSSITITSLPANGTLLFNGTPVTAGQIISAGDISNLSFRADSNASGDNFASFDYQVSDGSDTSNAHTINFNIAAQADQPVIDIATEQQTSVFTSSFEGATGVAAGQASFVDTVDGWLTASNSKIEVRGWSGDFYTANSGTHFIELNDDPTNQFPDALNIYRDINTEAGAKYELSFYYSPRPGYDEDTTKIEVWWDGKLIDTIAQDGGSDPNATNSWHQYNYTLAGDGTSARLEFRTAGDPRSGGRGGFLDDVQLTETRGGSATGYEDTTIKLPDITVTAVDPSEQVTYSLSGMPISTVISDGVNSEVFSGGQLDISNWTLSNLSLTPPPGHKTDIDLTFTATATEPSTGHSTQATETIHVDILSLPEQVGSPQYVDGDTSANVLTGGDGIDFISGGFGHDTLTGGEGADQFIWHRDDSGALTNEGVVTVAPDPNNPQVDHVTDFEAHKDILNVKDLLAGENAQNIDNFLTLNFSGGSTTIDVSPNGDGQVYQKIVLDNVDLSTQYGGGSSHDIILNMIQEGTLVIDQ
ncbi:retention module-containing protein [Spartinivicinus poritis]|uniref:Retention module-containing protein n=1 Tax=Spartinivicinus poritis TaxID=2994640 RepID=A0ABT5UAD9_9GAMM|nr:retention module-containing protein [Spartinivicinus sp. A2-2]MDE1463327.1 retention module-containing protein [Spartinivicinus sp. A2-2]